GIIVCFFRIASMASPTAFATGLCGRFLSRSTSLAIVCRSPISQASPMAAAALAMASNSASGENVGISIHSTAAPAQLLWRGNCHSLGGRSRAASARYDTSALAEPGDGHGAPRPMKMGTTLSPWRYDAAADQAIRPDKPRQTAILRYASEAAASRPIDTGPFRQSWKRRDG